MPHETDHPSFKNFLQSETFQQWVLFPDADKTGYWEGYYQNHPDQRQAIDEARNLILVLRFKDERPNQETIEQSLAQALAKIKAKENTRLPIHKIHPKNRISSFWWAAAALVPLVFSAWFIFNYSGNDSKVAEADTTPWQTTPSIEPGTDRAMLTLADGSIVFLDTADQQAIMGQQNVKLFNSNGQLSYKTTAQTSDAKEVQFNKINTPRGGQYALVLHDGTKVWLNAASSLRYPTLFTNGQRVVELEGEGYFEVAENASKPFIVKMTDGTQVTVLGTHFNINSYADENTIKTTLLQGSVLVQQGDLHQKLKPGDQAQTGQNKFDVVHVENTDQIIAWKNGYFSFQNKDLESIMRQLSRWYDVEVSFPEGVPDVLFSGELDRHLKLEELLEVFSSMKINHQIINRKLIITP